MRSLKYNKASDSYVKTVQKATGTKPALREVTLAHGDTALPHGLVEKYGHRQLYHTYLFSPGHAADLDHAHLIGTSVSLQEAIADVRRAWEK
jgi:hypothetical protein